MNASRVLGELIIACDQISSFMTLETNLIGLCEKMLSLDETLKQRSMWMLSNIIVSNEQNA
jgi:hypothetical protein